MGNGKDGLKKQNGIKELPIAFKIPGYLQKDIRELDRKSVV